MSETIRGERELSVEQKEVMFKEFRDVATRRLNEAKAMGETTRGESGSITVSMLDELTGNRIFIESIPQRQGSDFQETVLAVTVRPPAATRPAYRLGDLLSTESAHSSNLGAAIIRNGLPLDPETNIIEHSVQYSFGRPYDKLRNAELEVPSVAGQPRVNTQNTTSSMSNPLEFSEIAAQINRATIPPIKVVAV